MPTTASRAAESPPPVTTAPRQKMKILLVDDSKDNLFSVQTALEPLGEEIMLASSGKDALRLCLDNDFAVILLDVRMPDMDGFETAEFIRSRKRSKHTPLLFLTAYRSDEQLFRGYDLGAVDFLFRPLVPEILQSKVRVFVELSRTAQMMRENAATLAKAEAKFRSVLEAAPDAMVLTTRNGEIVLANSRTDVLFGYSRERLLALNISILVPEWVGECRGDFQEDDVGEGTGPYRSARVRAFRRDGSEFPAEVTTSPLMTEEGMLVTSAIRDVTERVRAEESIRRLNTELERRVAERTAELSRSNDALRQFAWAASHDLQEPVRMVISFAQMLAESALPKLDEEESQLLSTVEESGRRADALLSALRQYLHIAESTGGQPIEPVDCNQLVESVLEDLSGAIHQAEAVTACNPLPTLTIPRVLLVQVFRNLITNAVKYRSDQPLDIRISAEQRGSEWVFSVKDNGIGIEKDYNEYIFGMFKRLHPNKYAGAGMGLAIAKAAVERWGGRICAESEPGKGSTFKFTVPVGGGIDDQS